MVLQSNSCNFSCSDWSIFYFLLTHVTNVLKLGPKKYDFSHRQPPIFVTGLRPTVTQHRTKYDDTLIWKDRTKCELQFLDIQIIKKILKNLPNKICEKSFYFFLSRMKLKKELALSLIILTLTAIIRLISDNELLLFWCELLDIVTLSTIFIVHLWVKK